MKHNALCSKYSFKVSGSPNLHKICPYTVIASKHNSEWCRTCVYIGTVVESIEVFYLVIQVLTLVPFLHIIGKMEGDSTTLNCSTAHIAHVIHFAECT